MLRPACVPGGGFGCARGASRRGRGTRRPARAARQMHFGAPRRTVGSAAGANAAREGARVGLRRRSDGQARRVAGGRNVRSKTRWLAGSLQFAPRIACRRVLHRRRSQEIRCRGLCWRPLPPRSGGRGAPEGLRDYDASAKGEAALPCGRGLCGRRTKELAGRGGPAPPCNDPSAGSPTETLLRLLLPLGDRVRTASRPRAVVADRPPAGPEASPGRPIGSSDGRCVQRAGT